MALVLCQSIAGVCQATLYLVTCPCRLCGRTCEGVIHALASPFTPYLVTTMALHLPSVGWGVRAAVGVLNQQIRCPPGDKWLWVNAGLSILHILASFYIVRRVQEDRPDAEVGGGGDGGGGPVVQVIEDGDAVADDEDDDDVWNGVADGNPSPPRTKYQNLQNTSGTAGNSDSITTQQWSKAAQQRQDGIKSPTLGDKILYTMTSASSFPTIPATKSWKERASKDVVLFNNEGGGISDGEPNSIQRLQHVFCYDIVVAMYFVLSIFWCIWQAVGISQVLFPELRHYHRTNNYSNNNNYNNGDDDNYDDDAAQQQANAAASYQHELCDAIDYWTILSILCSFLYIMLVCVAFSCSLLCMRY